MYLDQITPTVGMGATIVAHSDRYPAEVVRVSESCKTCWIKKVTSAIVSGSELDGTAKYEFGKPQDDVYELKVYKSAKNGAWKLSLHGQTVWLNKQKRYHDPRF